MSEHIPTPWRPGALPALPEIPVRRLLRSEVERPPKPTTARWRFGPLRRFAALLWAIVFVEGRVMVPLFGLMSGPHDWCYRLCSVLADLTSLSPATVYSGLLATICVPVVIGELLVFCWLAGEPRWSEFYGWASGDPAPRNGS